MRLLLDTNAFLWWLSDDGQLGDAARAAIRSPESEVFVSVVSLWEVTIKVRVGKMRLDPGEVMEAVGAEGFTALGIREGHLRRLVGLPMHHRDPFDHMLIAQAIEEDAHLVSSDREMRAYPVRLVDAKV